MRAQETAENRRFLQKIEDFRRKPQIGLRHLDGPLARPYASCKQESKQANKRQRLEVAATIRIRFDLVEN